MPTITPNLWFDTEALEAAEHYCSIFPDSEITAVTHYTESGPGEEGTVLTVEFVLDGNRFVAINGGPVFPFTEAVSFTVACRDQDEVDYYWDRLVDGGVQDQAELDRYWDALLADGGEEGQCGWLKDKYGLSWQVVPEGMIEVLTSGDRERADRAMAAMMQMVKLDVAALEAAAEGRAPADV